LANSRMKCIFMGLMFLATAVLLPFDCPRIHADDPVKNMNDLIGRFKNRDKEQGDVNLNKGADKCAEGNREQGVEKNRHVRTLSDDAEDPLQAIRDLIEHFLPFTYDEEEAAVEQAKRRPLVPTKAGKLLWKKVRPYARQIRGASERFNVPQEVIAAIIIIESDGNRYAKNSKGTAKGLMQIVNKTWFSLKRRLEGIGVEMKDRFDPRSVILAGALYLSDNFEKARKKHPELELNRNEIKHWGYPMRYYFAGPDYEKMEVVYVPKWRQRCLRYSGGTVVPLKKVEDYSNKGIRWARLLGGAIG